MEIDILWNLKMHIIYNYKNFFAIQLRKKPKRAQFSRKQDLPIKRSILAAVLQIPSKIKC